MSRMAENTARGTAAHRGGEKVTPETHRDTSSMVYKKPFQIVGKPRIVGNLNDEYMRDPIHNESGPGDKGVWKKMEPVAPNPTDPRAEVPKKLENSVGEGGIGSVLGRQNNLEQQVYDIEESEI